MASVKPGKRSILAMALALAVLDMWCALSTRGAASSLPNDGLPKRDRPHVIVLSGEMPGAFRDVGRHSWIVANVPDRAGMFQYRRFEWLGAAEATDTDNPFDYFGNGEVAIHGAVTEDPAKRIAMVGPRSGCCAAGEASLASGAAPASMATGGAAAIGPPSLAGGATAGGAPHAQTKAVAASHRERDVMSMAR